MGCCRGEFLLAVMLASGLCMAQAPVRKLPPDAGSQAYRKRLPNVIQEHYPSLATGSISGTPVVTVLLNPDGTAAQTELSRKSVRQLTASESQFARFGVSGGDLQYVGVTRISLPGATAIVVFGATAPHELDRTLIERYSPKVLDTPPPPRDQPSVLLDHDGNVVRSGEEPIDPTHFPTTLEDRFPGIHTAEVTLTDVAGRESQPRKTADGQTVQLECIWLASGSPLPQGGKP